jgi:hypothetical protein
VDRLTQWEDRHDAKENVKTVSRVVQSFERTAIRSLVTMVSNRNYRMYADAVHSALEVDEEEVGRSRQDAEGEGERDAVSLGSSDIEKKACNMRRDDHFFDLFAAGVAAEMIWADATNGTRSMPKHLLDRLLQKKNDAMLNLARTIHSRNPAFSADNVGMPLMETTGSMCVSRGVLVVCPGSLSATYVLDIEQARGAAAGAPMDLSQVRTITITGVLEDEKPSPAGPIGGGAARG